MFENTKAYSGIAVHDLPTARKFYGETLGLRTSEEYGLMWLHLAGGRDTLVYQSPDLTPASYTILNFEVDDIDEAVGAPPRARRTLRALPRPQPRRQGRFPRTGTVHRLVQRPVRQRAVRPPRKITRAHT